MDNLNLLSAVPNQSRLKLIRNPLISEDLRSRYTALMFKFERELPRDDKRVYYATVHWDRVNHLAASGYYDEALRNEYI